MCYLHVSKNALLNSEIVSAMPISITSHSAILYWVVYIIVLIVGLGVGGGLLVQLQKFDRYLLLRKLAENSLLVILSVFLTLMATEFFFKFYAETDVRIYTLASKNWFVRYWHYNSQGYRDVEWDEQMLQQKKRVVVIGDSFAAGMGIEKIDNRFSNRLDKMLDDNFFVLNIAEVAIDTREEIERVKAFPYKPDILIWQYYINDMNDVAKEQGVVFPVPKTYPWPMLEFAVKNSYALNFVWWRSVAIGPRSWEQDYLTWVQDIYNSPAIWWHHQLDLQTICDGTKAEQIELIVVVFPSLSDVKRSQPITNKVIEFYQSQGVRVLDVAELVKDIPSEQLVVNPFDAHPNEWVHEIVAQELYEMLK